MPHLARAILIALSALVLLPTSAGAQADARRISVVGKASLSARNDTARLVLAVDARARTRREAIRRSSVRMRRVLRALGSAQIADRDLRTGSVTVFRLRNRRGRPLGRFEARQGVRVTVRDAERAGAIVDVAVRAGGVPVEGPTFFLADERGLLRRALVAALRDARAKAAALAAEAGLTLGVPTSIREAGFEPERVAAEGEPLESLGRGAPAPRPPTRIGRTRVAGTVFVVFEAR